MWHTPVLLPEILRAAAGASRAVDATMGDGGHAAALREAGFEVLGIDRDPEAVARARGRLGDRGLTYLQADYSSERALRAVRSFRPGFILLDLGVSSRQLDLEARGFTFRPGAPLDMRMEHVGESAADLLNLADEARLAGIFREYGDERRARPLAREVLRRRVNASFRISDDFVNTIRAVLGPRSGPGDFARLFQALRIGVNDELAGLERALTAFRDVLKPVGTLAAISYHSGEDRIVKHHFREWARACVCPPGLPLCTCRGRPYGRVDPRRPISPAEDEVSENPRARSARLRIFRVGDA